MADAEQDKESGEELLFGPSLSCQMFGIYDSSCKQLSLQICGETMHVAQDLSGGSGPGSYVYNSAISLCQFLKDIIPYNSTILEMGAGPGLPGLFLASKCELVILTDVPTVIPLIEQNLTLNEITNARAVVLDWDCPETLTQLCLLDSTCPLFIIASDVSYSLQLLTSFCSCVMDMARMIGNARPISLCIAHEDRDDEYLITREMMLLFSSSDFSFRLQNHTKLSKDFDICRILDDGSWAPEVYFHCILFELVVNQE